MKKEKKKKKKSSSPSHNLARHGSAFVQERSRSTSPQLGHVIRFDRSTTHTLEEEEEEEEGNLLDRIKAPSPNRELRCYMQEHEDLRRSNPQHDETQGRHCNGIGTNACVKLDENVVGATTLHSGPMYAFNFPTDDNDNVASFPMIEEEEEEVVFSSHEAEPSLSSSAPCSCCTTINTTSSTCDDGPSAMLGKWNDDEFLSIDDLLDKAFCGCDATMQEWIM